jgi:hypothetical protein
MVASLSNRAEGFVWMPHILLTGAGFSRNWGGWLADEAFEYLLGSPRIDDEIRSLLWKHKDKGGFEAALSELQKKAAEYPEIPAIERVPEFEKLAKLELSLGRMFDDMNRAFVRRRFEFADEPQYSVGRFLTKFDAIFTLNQDLLIEHHYIRAKYVQETDSRWQRCVIPGIEQIFDGSTDFINIEWSPVDDPKKRIVGQNEQPYFKLHGSSKWIDTIKGQRVLVIGGDKAFAIAEHEILMWYYDQFREYLAKPDTRLMVIGYSFRDEHINNAVGAVVARGGSLKLFIIDPDGVDVLDKDYRKNLFWGDSTARGPRMALFQNHLIGASRRTLREIFGGDAVEHGKVMRFFE